LCFCKYLVWSLDLPPEDRTHRDDNNAKDEPGAHLGLD
jgi:hypothetical protein